MTIRYCRHGRLPGNREPLASRVRGVPALATAREGVRDLRTDQPMSCLYPAGGQQPLGPRGRAFGGRSSLRDGRKAVKRWCCPGSDGYLRVKVGRVALRLPFRENSAIIRGSEAGWSSGRIVSARAGAILSIAPAHLMSVLSEGWNAPLGNVARPQNRVIGRRVRVSGG